LNEDYERVWLHAKAGHAVGSVTPQLCGGKNGRHTPHLRHRQNDKPGKQNDSCGGQSLHGYRAATKVADFWHAACNQTRTI